VSDVPGQEQDPRQELDPARTPDPAGFVYRVDASAAENVLVGDHGFLNVYNYN
jgi:hypothetical protein